MRWSSALLGSFPEALFFCSIAMFLILDSCFWFLSSISPCPSWYSCSLSLALTSSLQKILSSKKFAHLRNSHLDFSSQKRNLIDFVLSPFVPRRAACSETSKVLNISRYMSCLMSSMAVLSSGRPNMMALFLIIIMSIVSLCLQIHYFVLVGFKFSSRDAIICSVLVVSFCGLT